MIVVAGGPPPLLPAPDDGARLIGADLRHPEQLRALFSALAAPAPAVEDRTARARVDRDLIAEARKLIDDEILDHHAKQLLRAYGVRVSRQGVRNTPTAAVELAKTIGLPVMVACGEVERAAERMPDVRRLAALLLQQAGRNPSVTIRERFPEVPRARVRVQAEKGLGLTLRVGEACALVPLTRADALDLATATAARRAADQRAVAELLQRVAECAHGENALFDLEIFVGAEPAVIKASGTLRAPERGAPASAP